MDESVKGIEDDLKTARGDLNYAYGTYKNDDIEYILSQIKELEEQLRISREAHADTMNGQAERIKELEGELFNIKNALDAITSIHQESTNKGILNEAKVMELEESIEEWKTCLSAEILSLEQRDRMRAEARVKALEEGIESLKRNIQKDIREIIGIEDISTKDRIDLLMRYSGKLVSK